MSNYAVYARVIMECDVGHVRAASMEEAALMAVQMIKDDPQILLTQQENLGLTFVEEFDGIQVIKDQTDVEWFSEKGEKGNPHPHKKKAAILDSILARKELLPCLIGIDLQLDKYIHKALKEV